MPSPAAHALFGLTCLHLLRSAFPGLVSNSRPLIGMVLLASLAPDLDFIPGLVLGDPSRYHQTFSHSLGAAFLLALALGGGLRLILSHGPAFRWAGLFLLLALGHLLLDYFTRDTRPPIGFPLFWPFSDQLLTSPLPIFPYLIRDTARPGFWSHNLFTLLVEGLLLLPLWLVARRLDPGRSSLNNP